MTSSKLFRFLFFAAALFYSATLIAQPTFTIQNKKDACDGLDNGSFEILVSAATTPPLRAFIFGPPDQGPINLTVGVAQTISGLDGGKTYLVVVQDANGSSPQFVTINDVATINASVDPSSPKNNNNCTVPNGFVHISVSGGSGNFTYAWTSTNGYTASTQDIDDLSGGDYSVLITDNNTNCTRTLGPFTVTDPSPTAYAVGTTTPNICIGSGGTITLSDSETSVDYTVYKDGVATTVTLAGTNGALSFAIPASELTPAGTYNFTIEGINGACTPVFMSGSADIIVAPNNTAGAASSTPTLCINTALTNITHATTGATGIGVATGLPAGVSAAWASNVITISGTPTASGTFNYSIPLTGGCGTVNATGTINVNPSNTAGAASSTPTLCVNTALTNITHTTTGATGIGAATGLPAGVTAAWASDVITISGTPTASGTFNYLIPLTGGCGTVNATGTITVSANNTVGAASSTPTLCINTALTNITHTTTGATGIGAATGLPAGVTAAWSANVITISGTPTASGTFNYSIPLTGGCGTVNATGTITVTPNNTAGAPSSTPTVCISTALTNITHTTTGATGIGAPTGLPGGVSAAWASNVITISGTPNSSGTFNYSIPLTGGCGSVSATGTITVNANNTAGAPSSNPTLCVNTAMTNITRTTTGATGIGAPTGLPAGVTASWAANVITISGTPTASGTFNYSIPLTGGCGNVNATGTITVTAGNTVGAASSTPTLCINTALTNITHTTTGATGIGAATGLPAGVTAAWAANVITISGTPTASGTFNYSIPLTGGCGTVNATGTITVTPNNTAGAPSSTPTVCISTALTNITHATTGATGIGAPTGLPGGVTASWAANVITISGTPNSSGTFNYSIPLTGGCGNVSATGTITVSPNNTVGAPSSNPTLCVNTAMTNITRTTTGATGIGAATGLPAGVTAAWAANVITISGTPTASGTFNYSVPLTGGCGNVNATGTITVTADNTAGAASSTPTLCVNTALTNITHATTGATGIGAPTGLPAGVTASWAANVITISGTPTASGTFNYTIPLTGGCGTVNATGTITVTTNNTAGAASSAPTLCINTALTNITHATTGATGIGAATGLPAGVTAAWVANVITISGTPTASGTFNYSIPLTGGCGTVNATGTITVTANNTAGVASSTPTLCVNTALTNITHATTGATGIGAATGLPAGVTAAWAANVITISGTPTASGTFNYTIPLTGGCGTVNATGTITVNTDNTASAASSTPTLCTNTALTNITHTTTGATGIGAPTGLPAGVIAAWSANVITISGTPTAAGTFNYSIPLTGGCGAVNATGTITVTPGNTAGAASSTPTLCINTALTDITHATTGATGIGAATGLPAGVTATWAANVITISGTPTAAGTFNYSIPLTGGCGTVNATGTITVNVNTAAAPSSTPTLCINTALTNITHVTTGATGIGAPTGLPTGVTAAWAANTITISGTPTVAGTFNYSIPLTGGCGTVNATGTITVTTDNTAGAASSTPTLCINTALTNITHTTTGATGIGAPIGLPAGVSAAWASNVITISGTPTASGTFNYSIPLVGGCGAVNATGTITVNANNIAGAASSTPTLCINTALTNITHTTTGATGIGAATGLPAGVTAAWAADIITISGTPTASGAFNYSIPLTGGCGTVNATGTITVNINTAGAASSSPTICINSPLTNITHATTGATGIGAPTGLPAGVTAAWAANVITISGTPTASGTFNYSIPLTGGCGSVNATGTITVSQAPTTSNAGTDQSNVCGTVPLNGNVPVIGTGAWSFAPGGNTDGNGNIVAPSNNQSGFNGNPGVTYTLRWTITNGACSSSDDVQIQFDPTGVTPSNAGPNQSKCNDGSFTLAGNVPGLGAGTWTVVGSANGATITTPGANNSTVTGLNVGTSVTLRWTLTNGACTSADDVVLSNDASPTAAAAGNDQALCGTNATLAGNTPVVGVGTWTITGGTGGTVTDVNNPLAAFTGTSGTTYTLQWSVVNGSCAASTDNVTIQLDQAPTVSAAGSDQNGVCGTVSLNANAPVIGTGQWSFAPGGNPDNLGNITDPANRQSNFNGSTGVTYVLRWTISNGTCTSSTDDVQIQYDPTGPTPANAGTDQSICGPSTTLSGNSPTSGTGQWSFAPGGNPNGLGVIADVNNQVSSFSGTVGQTYILLWTITSGSCVSTDQVSVQFNVAPTTSNAGADQALCGTSTTLSANTPAVGTGSWSIVSGTGGSVTTPSSPTSGFTGTLGQTYTLRWSITNGGCSASTDDVAINFNPSLCGGGGTGTCATVVITPTPSPAQCTNSDGSILFDINPAVPVVNNTGVRIDIQGVSSTNLSINRTNYNNPTFTGLPAGTYTFQIEYGDPSCLKSGQVTIDQSGTVGTPSVSNIVGPVCDGAATGSVTLDVPGETGNVLEWSYDGGVIDPFKSFTAGSTITGIPAGVSPAFERVISVRRNFSDPCYAAVRFVIQPANAPIAATMVTTAATCDGNDGSINVTASGGSGTYTYSIDGGITYQSSNIFGSLSGGNYSITVQDGAGCLRSFPTSVTFPGFISATITPIDANCTNDGNSGGIDVEIPAVGTYQVAVSTDQFNEPADTEYRNYSSPSVTFTELARGQYFVYMKSNSSTCTTRSAAVNIAGIYAVSYDIQPICVNNELSLSLINLTGEPGRPVDINVYRKFTNALVQTITIPSIPPTESYLLDYDDYSFLRTPDEYQIQLSQSSSLNCSITSELADVVITTPVSAVAGDRKKSFPDIASGELEITNFTGGLAVYDIRIELDSASSLALPVYSSDWEEVQLNGDQQYQKVYEDVPPGRYQVQVMDQNGCTYAFVARVPLDDAIFIPNIFTPNDDGVNDIFFIRNLPTENGKANLIVANRWGKEVYSNSNYQNNWKGEGASDGVYYYQLTIGNGTPVTGWVEVLRGQKP
jgi:gliding motility-associated-like protein